MTNPFDQFDSLPTPPEAAKEVADVPKTANPFDQFDNAPPPGTPPEQRHYTLGQAVRALPSSIGPSLWHQFTNALKSVTLDLPETVENTGKLAADLTVGPELRLAYDQLGSHLSPEFQAKAKGFLDSLAEPKQALVADIKNRYGSWDNFKRTLAEDPGSILSDALMFTPGAPEKAATSLGRLAAKVPGAATTGRMLGKIPEMLPTEVLGKSTGVGSEAISAMGRAGRQGNKDALRNMNRQVPYSDVVDDLHDVLGTIHKNAQNDYLATMDKVKLNNSPVDLGNIDQVMKNADDIGVRSFDLPTTSGGTAKYNIKTETNPNALNIRKQIADAVEKWKSPADLPPGVDPGDYAKIVHTPWGLDSLKQIVGNLRNSLSPTENGFRPAYAYATSVYNGLKKEIERVDPHYAKAMEQYGTAQDLLGEARRALALKNTSSVDSSLRRLQSVFRNDVNTSYGNRVDLFRQLLQKAGRPDLEGKLAGQAMSSYFPRGIQRIGGPIELLGMSMLHPGLAATFPAFSPRLVGRGAYYYGRAAEKVGNPLAPLASHAGVLPAISRLNPEDEPQEKRGGFFRGRRR